MSDYVIGIDLGGTKVEACLLDGERNLLARERVFVEASLGRQKVIDNICGLVEKISSGKNIAAVGMGTPGTYIDNKDVIYGAPHTLLYEEPGFISALGKQMGKPLFIENDANCLALAEYFASCDGKYDNVLAVILGTGFGSGFILDKKLYRGITGGAAELGHTAINIGGRLCECGRAGCVEAYLSGPSNARRFFEMTGKKLTVPKIYKLYEKGDAQAADLFAESCLIMAEVFANAVNILDLQAIILGGGVSNLPIWYRDVPALMSKSLFGVPRGDIPLIKAQLGDSAGVFGAAYLALRYLGLMNF